MWPFSKKEEEKVDDHIALLEMLTESVPNGKAAAAVIEYKRRCEPIEVEADVKMEEFNKREADIREMFMELKADYIKFMNAHMLRHAEVADNLIKEFNGK